MTTNVYDLTDSLLTCDSRWSYEEAGWIVYIDDTGYDKIVFDQQLAILFAGSMPNINCWKKWFFAGRVDPAPMDHLDEISIIGVDVGTGELVFLSDYLLFSNSIEVIEACYGGTGGPYAKDCWQMNKCAKKAVETAIVEDNFSGGKILYLHRNTLETNVTNAGSYTSVATQAKERGIMINTNSTQQTISVRDAANDPSNPVAKSIAEKIMSGKAAFSAPFPGMRQPWTKEKKEELSRVLARYAPTK